MSEINNSSFNDLYGDDKTPISNNINELVNIYSTIDNNESLNKIDNITNIQNSIYDHLSNITNIVQTTLGEIDKTSSGVTYLTIPDHIDNYKNQTKDYRSYFRQPKYIYYNEPAYVPYLKYGTSKISKSTVQPVNTFGVSNLSYMFANTAMTSIVNNGKNKAVIDNDENLTMQYFDMMNKNLSYCFDGSGVQYVNSFNISGSTVYNMFRDTEKLDSVYFLNANLKDSSYMFYNSGITSVENSVFNLSNCSHMFENCTNLRTINRDNLVQLKPLFESSMNNNSDTVLALSYNYYQSPYICYDDARISDVNFINYAKYKDEISYINENDYDSANSIISSGKYNGDNVNLYTTVINTYTNSYNDINGLNIKTTIIDDSLFGGGLNGSFKYGSSGEYGYSMAFRGDMWMYASAKLYTNQGYPRFLKSHYYKTSGSPSVNYITPYIYDKKGNLLNNTEPNHIYEVYNKSSDSVAKINAYDFDRMWIYETSSGDFFKNITNASRMFANCTNLISVDGCNTANISYFNTYHGSIENRYSDTSVTSINMHRCTDASYMFSGCNHLTFHKISASKFFKIGPENDADFILNKTCNVVGMFSNINYPYGAYTYQTLSDGDETGNGSLNPLLSQYSVYYTDIGAGSYNRISNMYFNIRYPVINSMFYGMHLIDNGVTINITSNCTSACELFANSNIQCNGVFLNLPNLINGHKLFYNTQTYFTLDSPNIKDLSYAFAYYNETYQAYRYNTTITLNQLPFATSFKNSNGGNIFSTSYLSESLLTNSMANSVTNISGAFMNYVIQCSHSYCGNYTSLVFPNVEDASHAFEGVHFPSKQGGYDNQESYIDVYMPKCKNFSYAFSNTGKNPLTRHERYIDFYDSMLNSEDISHMFDSSGVIVYNFSITNKCTNMIGWTNNAGVRFDIKTIRDETRIKCDFDASHCDTSKYYEHSIKFPTKFIFNNTKYFVNFSQDTKNHYIILPDDSYSYSSGFYINSYYNTRCELINSSTKTNLQNLGWTFIKKSEYIKKTGITW